MNSFQFVFTEQIMDEFSLSFFGKGRRYNKKKQISSLFVLVGSVKEM